MGGIEKGVLTRKADKNVRLLRISLNHLKRMIADIRLMQSLANFSIGMVLDELDLLFEENLVSPNLCNCRK